MDFGGLVVRPAHRHFGGAQAVALGEKQNLGIESPALNALLFEDDAGRLALENFEAALGIVDRNPGKERTSKLKIMPAVSRSFDWRADMSERSMAREPMAT